MKPEPAQEALRQLERQAAKSGMSIAVDRVNGHWRAGFLMTNEVGEPVFGLHAVGPDEGTAITRLAELAAARD